MANQIADKEAVSSQEAALAEEAAFPKEAVLAWTDERGEQLRRLWLDGLSASRIAGELAGGVTRNAVIGKVHRLGLSGRIKAPAVAAGIRPKLAKPAEAAPQRPTVLPVRGNVALAASYQPAAMPLRRSSSEDRVVSMVENVTIMDLRDSMCRWPVGDPSSSEFRYCGGKASVGEGPYCKLHSRMAYQPVQDRRQRKIA